MKLREMPKLMRVARPPAPYGTRSLARCVSIEDLARLARRRLPSGARAYLEGGGEDEHTLRRNRAAFAELELVPRVLRDVSDVDTSTTVLGSRVPLPLVLAPVGAPRMFHHEGERAVARAAGAAGIPYAISTLGTVSVEEVAAASGGPLWFQLYVWGDRGVAREALARARAAGYRVLLLSADTTVRSKREREKHAGLSLPEPELTLRSFLDGALHPSWSWHFLTSDAIAFPNIGQGAGSRARVQELFDGTVSWDDLDWIRAAWDGPVAVKGIVRAEEARRAARGPARLGHPPREQHRGCAGARRAGGPGRPRAPLRARRGRRAGRAPRDRHPRLRAAHEHGAVRRLPPRGPRPWPGPGPAGAVGHACVTALARSRRPHRRWGRSTGPRAR